MPHFIRSRGSEFYYCTDEERDRLFHALTQTLKNLNPRYRLTALTADQLTELLK